MKITSLEEYGLRCMMQLALSETDGPMTVAQVGQREGLSTEYAGKLLHLLGQAGLVRSVRGRNGGFVLARGSGQITVAAIVRALSTDLFDSEFCERHAGTGEVCVHQSSCTLRPVWSTVSEIINQTLESITLHDLIDPKRSDGIASQNSREASTIRIGAGGDGRILRLNQVRIPDAG